MSDLNVYAVGASRNTGYHAAVRLLEAGATVTFLLRNLSSMDTNTTIQKFVSAGKAFLIKGDALSEDDCRRGWESTLERGHIDFLFFCVGGTPEFHLTKGMIFHPENLVTQSFLNVLASRPTSCTDAKFICVSSTGLTKTSHDSLPLLLKPVYSRLLAAPHRDKVGMERAIAHFTARPWNAEKDGEPGDDIMGAGWKERQGMPVPGSLQDIVVVRPAFLTDGDCKADNPKKSKAPYRASTDELGGYVVSRQDVAHFIATVILQDYPKWRGKIVNVGY
ncbi:hypothetical protein DL96DRAFT_1499088 [Flagelloscypha sp. PMI_526]|nr:hypothetical protein DL96DRAFT_1499088 [Flagelloscypha sp. PMI_526]